ncbi:MAG: putative Ig domain-containing protein [Gemmatimonadetes bacterium]|nr:putative Ig domain-containing protein [Gemmatimonadota bacterium]
MAGSLLVVALAACGGDSTGPPPEPLSLTTTSLPGGTIGVAYTAAVSATGGTLEYEWEVTQGALPPGLTLSLEDLPDGDDLVITGTPEQVGNYTFTLRVTSRDGQTASRQFTIEVLEPVALSIENLLLPPALRGGPYDVRLRPVGGTSTDYAWSIAGGALPAGLNLTSDGRLHGTPTATDTTTVTLRLTAGGEEVTKAFDLRVVANRTATYDLTPVAVSTIPANIQPHVDEAIAQWEDVLSGDLIPITIPPTQFGPEICGGFGDGVNGTTVDDILVLINIAAIDGPGEVLGQAGPCLVRDSSRLPVAGILTLDSEDLLPLVGTNTLTHVIAHEIGHVLGFGSLWEEGLLLGEGGADPRFTGENAVAEWHALGGTGNVPVENGGGQGTAGSHWEEGDAGRPGFGNELMTGFTEPVGIFQPLSRVTIGAMEDIGYAVDYTAADAYTLGLALLAPGAASGREIGRDIVLDLRIHVVDARYTPVELLERVRGNP